MGDANENLELEEEVLVIGENVTTSSRISLKSGKTTEEKDKLISNNQEEDKRRLLISIFLTIHLIAAILQVWIYISVINLLHLLLNFSSV